MPVIEDAVGLTVDRIMLATDFLPASEVATEYAKALAKRFSSALLLTHVIDLSAAARREVAAGRPLDEMRQTAGDSFLRLVHGLSSTGIRSTSHTMEDSHPAAAVVRLAKRLEADLIVTGTHGRHGWSKVLLGSCADGIIRHAECPVLTIGPRVKPVSAEGISFRKIVFATDFHSNAIEAAAVACAFAKDAMAKLYLCHIVSEESGSVSDRRELQAKMESALHSMVPDASYEWIDPEFVVEHGRTADEIVGLASHVGADLIVLGAKRSTFLGSHLVNGVVAQVLAKAECPVMTVRARAVEAR
jgi:nucleotide-binding universal stress UspA family protein